MNITGNKEKRSPLREKPLHNPGESLEQEWNRQLYEEVAPHIYGVLFIIILVGLEWVRWLTRMPPQPLAFTILGILFGGYSVYKMISYFPKMRSLWQGVQGEKVVGQELNLVLRGDGYRVFHDVPAKGFNIDHVIVSDRGLYLVETKTFSKAIKGNPKITFDGEQVLVDGVKPDRDPVNQALALRKWLIELLEERTARQFPVRAVVVFPGWYVERTTTTRRDDLWVLNPKGIAKFIEHEPVVLKPEEVALASSTLATYIQKYDERV
jgi:hypothetical protein